MRRLVTLVVALVLLSGCATISGYYPRRSVVVAAPSVSITVTDMSGNIHLDWDWAEIWAMNNSPKLQYQNQFGGWEVARNHDFMVIPGNVDAFLFQVIPNGRVVSIEAIYDGNPIGGGMYFGVGNVHDGGRRLLKVIVKRSLKREVDFVPEDAVITDVIRVIVFNKNGN